eukprot:755200-Hanusia_phi.AAC.1
MCSAIVATSSFVLGDIPVISLLVAVISASTIIHMEAVKSRSKHSVRQDAIAFDAEWSRLMETKEGREQVRQLKEQVEVLNDKCKPKQLHGLRHVNPFVLTTSRHSSLSAESFKPPKLITIEKMNMSMYVDSLDQLYCQAVAVYPLFAHKTLQLAARADGCLRTSSGTELVSGSDALASTECSNKVMWERIKPVDEVVDDIAIFHDWDVSKACDVVSQCIVFSDLEALRKCVNFVAEDGDISVLALHNTFDDMDDAVSSAGYRDCIVYFRFKTESAAQSCVSGFVCRLVLELVEFVKQTNQPQVLRRRLYNQITSLHKSPLSQEMQDRRWLPRARESARRALSMVTINPTEEPPAAAQARSQELVQHRCYYPGNILDERLNQERLAVKTAATVSVWFTSRPTTHALGKPIVHGILFLFAVYYFYLSVSSLQTSMNNSRFQVYHARFSAIEYRNSSLPVDVA